MGLSPFIVAVFCLVDDQLKGRHRLRQRGAALKLFDAKATRAPELINL